MAEKNLRRLDSEREAPKSRCDLCKQEIVGKVVFNSLEEQAARAAAQSDIYSPCLECGRIVPQLGMNYKIKVKKRVQGLERMKHEEENGTLTRNKVSMGEGTA